MTSEDHAFRDGFFTATEKMMGWINSLDSSDMTPKQIRSVIYEKLQELRPPVRVSNDA